MKRIPSAPTRREALLLGAKLAAGAAVFGSAPLASAAQAIRAPSAATQTSGAARSGASALRVFDVHDYGAAGDGTTLDTAAIQRAIDAASASAEAMAAGAAATPTPGARVLLRGGKKYLIGTLVLRSGIDFHLADDAELRISTNKTDYVIGGETVGDGDAAGGGVLTANAANGLRISGTGSINGRGTEFMSGYDKVNEWYLPIGWRPRIFQLVACGHLEVRDITMAAAPAWGLHLIGCDGVLVENFKIRNNLKIPNCDGIDPDHCRNVEIRGCDIVCGDDAIAIKTSRAYVSYGASSNIHVADCKITTQDAGLKIGSESCSDLSGIRFERCTILQASRGLCIQVRDSGNVSDVQFSDINFVSRYFSAPWWGRGEGISLTAMPRNSQTQVGAISNVRFKNIVGRAENSMRVEGCAASRVSGVTFESVAVTLDRWSKYPGGIFDNRPTTAQTDLEKHATPGFSIRHADQVRLSKCSVAWGKNLPDYFSHALEAEDAHALDLSGFTGHAAHPERDSDVSIL